MKKNDEKTQNQEEIKKEEKDGTREEKDDKKVKCKEGEKALFIQRLGAYIIDILLVSLIASFFTTPFIDMDKYKELSNKSMEISEKYMNKEIDFETFNIQYVDVSYKVARNTGLLVIITIALEILYYVVFQIYNNGQTLGKKLLKIKVVSDRGDLTMNQMIYRSFLSTTIILETLSVIFVLTGSRDAYFWGTGIVGMIMYAIIIASCFMVMYGKEGRAIHDKLAHTKVVRI